MNIAIITLTLRISSPEDVQHDIKIVAFILLASQLVFLF